jgi:isoquinoline 1-oxidoreductase beta subunit
VGSAAAEKVAGVRRVLRIDAGIAVVADSFWSACMGREALEVEWDEGANARLSSDGIRQQLGRAAKRHGAVTAARGDAERALAEAAELIEAIYDTPYLAHATLEPMNCTAHVRSDGCDVWVPTQAQQGAWEAAARESGLRKSAVRIHTTYLGGGFGRRGLQDFVIEAVQVSRAMQTPVQVLWTREDDLCHDFYRPAHRPAHRAVLRAALRRGRPVAWWQRIVGPELALDGVDMPYAIANFHDERVKCDPGIPTGPWRSVGASQNAFVIESFIDELAHAAGRDPLAYRLDLLAASPRHRRVLELAAEQSGWAQPPARGRGSPIPSAHRHDMRRRGFAPVLCTAAWRRRQAIGCARAAGNPAKAQTGTLAHRPLPRGCPPRTLPRERLGPNGLCKTIDTARPKLTIPIATAVAAVQSNEVYPPK